MIRVLVVTADNEHHTEDCVGSLEWFQAQVDGFVEAIHGPGWSAYINEDGRMRGLDFNTKATTIARMMRWGNPAMLRGTVVFVGEPDRDGNDTSVPGGIVGMANTMKIG